MVQGGSEWFGEGQWFNEGQSSSVRVRVVQ